MDGQGMGGAILLPTLGVGMEQALLHDPEALIAAFRAFQPVMEEDWGFSYKERIFAAPIFTLVDADAAWRQLNWALEKDARFVLLLPGPVINALGRTVAVGPDLRPILAALERLRRDGAGSRWGQLVFQLPQGLGPRRPRTRRSGRTPSGLSCRTTKPQDLFANLLAHHHFHRFPNLRIASIETGSDWCSTCSTSSRSRTVRLRTSTRRTPGRPSCARVRFTVLRGPAGVASASSSDRIES